MVFRRTLSAFPPGRGRWPEGSDEGERMVRNRFMEPHCIMNRLSRFSCFRSSCGSPLFFQTTHPCLCNRTITGQDSSLLILSRSPRGEAGYRLFVTPSVMFD